MSANKTKITILLLTLTIFTGYAAADYEFELVNEYQYENVGNDTKIIHVVELQNPEDTSEGIPPSALGDNEEFVYDYNLEEDPDTGDEVEEQMIHYDYHELESEGYWYAEFETTEHENDEIEYKVIETHDDGTTTTVASATEDVNVNEDFTFEVQTNFDEQIKAGSEQEIDIGLFENLDDGTQEEITEDDLDEIQLNFNNVTETVDEGTFGFQGDSGPADTKTFNVPEQTAARYFGHITLVNLEYTADGTTQTGDFTYNFILDTLPPVEGEVTQLEAQQGCSTSDLLTTATCEGNTTVETEYMVGTEDQEVTSPEQVEIRVNALNRTNLEWETLESTMLEENQTDQWLGEFTLPYIDNNQYDAEEGYEIELHATVDDQEDHQTFEVGYNGFSFDIDLSSTEALQGEDFEVLNHIRRPYTSEEMPNEEVNQIHTQLHYPNGTIFREYNLNNMTFMEGDERYQNIIELPTDIEPGTYTIDTQAEDNFHWEETAQREFELLDIQQIFQVHNFHTEINKTGNHTTQTLNVTNNLDEQTEVTVTKPESLENNMTLETEEPITLEPATHTEIPFNLTINEITTTEEEITLNHEDSNYNHTADFTIQGPECSFQNNNLCSMTGSSFNLDTDERETIETHLDIMYIGPQTETTNITLETEGNITEKLEYNQTQWTNHELNPTNDTANIPINYTVDRPGIFTGNITIQGTNSQLNYHTELNSTVPTQNLEFEITTEEIQIDEIIEEENHETNIEIENTGDITIDELNTNSQEAQPNITLNGQEIEPEETEEIQLEINDIIAANGEIEITASTEEQEHTDEITFNVENFIEDMIPQIQDLSEDLESLRAEDTEDVAEFTIDDAEARLTDAEIYFNDGDYETAQQEFDEAQTLYNEAQTQIDESQQPGNGDQNGDTGANGDQNGTTDPNGDDGGLPILPIAAVVMVLLLVGFVAYSSVIPEEGDPLYDVLEQ